MASRLSCRIDRATNYDADESRQPCDANAADSTNWVSTPTHVLDPQCVSQRIACCNQNAHLPKIMHQKSSIVIYLCGACAHGYIKHHMKGSPAQTQCCGDIVKCWHNVSFAMHVLQG